ncbi:MAG: alpha-hydroxy-acid oxidizing enzyme [Nocardioides sp.]|nr:alpha-hydroxy-acid oxidizing enzyme [Nocardioides sp.]
MPAHVHHYVTTGSRDGVSVAEAAEAWRAVRFRPRVLTGGVAPDLTTEVHGSRLTMPVGIAPTSLQRLVHPDGELAMARAALEAGTVLTVSSNAGTPFADIGATGVTWWLQAYLTADRDLIAPALRAAVAAGARAVVLTVDTPVPGHKYDVHDAPFGDLSGVYGVNHPDAVRGATPGAQHATDLGPDDIAWLADLTGVPVWVKGVLRSDDAGRAVAAGASGVWVSNHGGRQLDRSIPTAVALPEVAAAVGGRVPVAVDGGVRTGLDVLAALSSGADLAFQGRLPLLALASGGASGVAGLLSRVRDELEEALLLGGISSPAQAADLR